MERVKKYEKVIADVLKEYQSRFRQTSQDISNHIIVDDKNHHYQFLWLGWKGDKQIFNVAFHIDILDGKIWVQKDNTETGIANLLTERGIPKKDIVLAFYPPAHRELTEFAIG
jgi:XisI protein